MKSLAILILFVSLTSCEKKVPVVTVYDEVTTFTELTEDRETITTGAKLYLIDNVGLYSNVKVTLIHDGGSTELASYGLDSKDSKHIGMSLRFFPYRGGERHWALCYRLPTKQASIYSELIAEDWYVAHPNRSRHGRLNDDIEVIDSFVLMKSGKYFDIPMKDKYSACFTQEDLLEFSKEKNYVKFIRITLEK